MKLKQFVLAHSYSFQSEASRVANILRKKCYTYAPSAIVPKLGNHTTILPPLFAHPDEMRYFAMGLRMMKVAFGETPSSKNEVRGLGINFFRNTKSDALVIDLLLNEDYQETVEACRKELSSFANWVFPLYGEGYHPHLCVLEGSSLYEKLTPYMQSLSQGCGSDLSFTLPSPQIWVKETEKGTSRWELFDPQK